MNDNFSLTRRTETSIVNNATPCRTRILKNQLLTVSQRKPLPLNLHYIDAS